MGGDKEKKEEGAWKTAGVFGLQLLAKKKALGGGGAHVVWRDEVTGRALLNARLYKGMKVERAGKRGVSMLVLRVEEDADGKETTSMQKVLVRLKTPADADSFNGLMKEHLPK